MNIRISNSIHILLIIVLPIFSCTSSNDSQEAKRLLAEVYALSQNEDTIMQGRALTLLDTLHIKYPKAIEVRKEALRLSRELRLKKSKRDSIDLIKQYSEDSLLLMKMDDKFIRTKHQTLPSDEVLMRYEGYEPIDQNGHLFLDIYLRHNAQIGLVAGYSGKSLERANLIRVEHPQSGEYTLSDTIPLVDEGRNYHFTVDGVTRYRLTTSLEGTERIASFVAIHSKSNSPILVKLMNGENTIKSYHLTHKEITAITETFRFYSTYMDLKETEGQRQRNELYKNRLLSQVKEDNITTLIPKNCISEESASSSTNR